MGEKSRKVIAKHIHINLLKFGRYFRFFFSFDSHTAGERGLEIRCNGIGSSVFMDFHIGRVGWNGWHHITGAHAIR